METQRTRRARVPFAYGRTMALARIEVLHGLPPEERRRVIEAVHAAMIEALEVPADDPTVRLVEHRPENVRMPSERSDRYTVVEVTMFAGRSIRTKRRLYEATVRNLNSCGVPSEDVLVVLHEPVRENWGVQGGSPASEVDVGFRVDI